MVYGWCWPKHLPTATNVHYIHNNSQKAEAAVTLRIRKSLFSILALHRCLAIFWSPLLNAFFKALFRSGLL